MASQTPILHREPTKKITQSLDPKTFKKGVSDINKVLLSISKDLNKCTKLFSVQKTVKKEKPVVIPKISVPKIVSSKGQEKVYTKKTVSDKKPVAIPKKQATAGNSKNADKKPVAILKKDIKNSKLVNNLKTIADNFIENIKENFENFGKDFKDGIVTLHEQFTKGFLGPLNLIIQPLEDLFGTNFIKKFDSAVFKVVSSPIKLIKALDNKMNSQLKKSGISFFSKGKVVKPKRNDVMKSNPEIVWMTDELTKTKKGKNGEDVFGGFNLKNLASLIPGMLMKAGAVAALAAGLVWAFVDGIKGIKMSKEWGVSKVAGFIGSFLGSTKEGFAGAFSNMGKWALTGVGVGFVAAGPVGALAGGLIGAALGGILGFIGGENIAKGFQSIGDNIVSTWKSKENIPEKLVDTVGILFSAVWNGLTNIVSTIPQMIVQAITKDPKKAKIAKDISKDILDLGAGIFRMIEAFTPIGLIVNTTSALKKSVHILSSKDLTASSKFKKVLQTFIMTPFEELLNNRIFSRTSSTLSGVGDKIMNTASSLISSAVESLANLGKSAVKTKDEVTSFVKTLFSYVSNGIVSFFENDTIGKFVDKYIVTPVKNFFTSIADTFDFLTSRNIIQTIKDVASGDFAKNLEDFSKKKNIARTQLTPEYQDYAKSQVKNKSFTRASDEEKVVMYQNANPDAKVHDAIITPKGRIIRPDTDDTIIATKSPVINKKNQSINTFDSSNMQVILSDINKKINGFDMNTLLSKIDTLISAINNKPFNNIITSTENTKIDFDSLRKYA